MFSDVVWSLVKSDLEYILLFYTSTSEIVAWKPRTLN